jgi:hypothetical protein
MRSQHAFDSSGSGNGGGNTSASSDGRANIMATKLRTNPNKRASIAQALAVKAAIGNYEYTNTDADTNNDNRSHSSAGSESESVSEHSATERFARNRNATGQSRPHQKEVPPSPQWQMQQATHGAPPASNMSRSNLRSNPNKRASIAEALAVKATVGNFEYTSSPARDAFHADASASDRQTVVVPMPTALADSLHVDLEESSADRHRPRTFSNKRKTVVHHAAMKLSAHSGDNHADDHHIHHVKPKQISNTDNSYGADDHGQSHASNVETRQEIWPSISDTTTALGTATTSSSANFADVEDEEYENWLRQSHHPFHSPGESVTRKELDEDQHAHDDFVGPSAESLGRPVRHNSHTEMAGKLRANPNRRASITQALALKATSGNQEYIVEAREQSHADASATGSSQKQVTCVMQAVCASCIRYLINIFCQTMPVPSALADSHHFHHEIGEEGKGPAPPKPKAVVHVAAPKFSSSRLDTDSSSNSTVVRIQQQQSTRGSFTNATENEKQKEPIRSPKLSPRDLSEYSSQSTSPAAHSRTLTSLFSEIEEDTGVNDDEHAEYVASIKGTRRLSKSIENINASILPPASGAAASTNAPTTGVFNERVRLRSHAHKRQSIVEALAIKAKLGNFEYVADPRAQSQADASSISDSTAPVMLFLSLLWQHE